MNSGPTDYELGMAAMDPQYYKESLKTYVCTDFTGCYPVGTSAIVFAESEEQAVELLLADLKKLHLPQEDPPTVVLLKNTMPSVIILQDGNY